MMWIIMWNCENVKIRKCGFGKYKLWKCVDVKMQKCKNMTLWKYGDFLAMKHAQQSVF